MTRAIELLAHVRGDQVWLQEYMYAQNFTQKLADTSTVAVATSSFGLSLSLTFGLRRVVNAGVTAVFVNRANARHQVRCCWHRLHRVPAQVLEYHSRQTLVSPHQFTTWGQNEENANAV